MYRLIVILLAIVVGVAGFNADAKKKSRGYKSTTNKAIVHPEPKGYEPVQGDFCGVEDFEALKYPPEYPGGLAGLMQFFASNINYPKSAEKKGIEGIVILQFIVEKSGAVSDVKVLKSVDKALDNEAVRVVKALKYFIPGYNEDHAPMRVQFVLPVNFKLE